MKERVLHTDIDTTITLLEGTKWKFYEVHDDKIRVEVPRAYDLTLVVELPKNDLNEKRLKADGFLKSETRTISP